MSDDIFKGAAGGLAGGIGGAIISSLLGSEAPSPANIPPPSVEAPSELPTAKSPDITAAKKRSIMEMRKRKGRASTILTQDTSVSDALGG